MPGQQDTVHSYRPTLPITYQYHLKPGESFYKDRNGKVTIVRSRNEQVSKDTRNNWQKKQDSKNKLTILKQIKYLKEGQETRSRGLAAQEWMQDNHSVEVPQTVDNGVNFFTDKSLRNVWRGIASTIPIIQGYSQIMQNNTQEKQTK